MDLYIIRSFLNKKLCHPLLKSIFELKEKMNITKDNYKDIVWDEKIDNEDYFALYKSLNFEEKVTFLKFLLENYPAYDEDWTEYFFDIKDTWRRENQWEQLIDFSDFVREKSPLTYKKEFNYLDEEPTLYAAFHKDLEKVKIRFAETVTQPVEAVDDTLRSVFNILSTDTYFKNYTKEVAEKVWKPLAQSDKLIGDASYNYTAYLYCDFLETAFKQIKTGIPVDWEIFKTNVERINFKYVEHFSKLPDLEVAIEKGEFRTNPTYRNEKLEVLLVSMLYEVHTTRGIPVYWLFRTWFDLRQYLWEREDAPNRKNWFSFTPKMIDGFVNSLYGFIGGNKDAMFIAMWTLPYIFDYFLEKQYIDRVLFSRLMEYYQHVKRDNFLPYRRNLWKYKALYDWNKPSYISTEEFEQEKQLALQSIGWKQEEARQKIKAHIDTLPELPSYVIPPKRPSIMDNIMSRTKSNPLPALGNSSNSGSTRKLRKKKPRKKKHKDNRKRGSKKNKRK